MLRKLVVLTTSRTCHAPPVLLQLALAMLSVAVDAFCVIAGFVFSNMVSVPRVLMPSPLRSKKTVIKISLDNLRQGRHMVRILIKYRHQKYLVNHFTCYSKNSFILFL